MNNETNKSDSLNQRGQNKNAAAAPSSGSATQYIVFGGMTVVLGPCDRRCRWWAKHIAASGRLPHPAEVRGACSLAQCFEKRGQFWLPPGDFVIEGEEVHHRKARGWFYWLRGVDPTGKRIVIESGEFGPLKPLLKDAGLAADLLSGRGDIAAAVRVIHAVRAGIDVTGLICSGGQPHVA